MAKITEAIAKQLRSEFLSCPKNRLAMNVCTKHGPIPAVTPRSALEGVYHVFNHKVDEMKPVTNQKQSGRCWIFSLLNVMRIPFCKQLKIEDFEFSQSYLFFWDKVERSNFFLNNVVEAYRKGEAPSGRLVSFFLQEPASDAGQWDMLVNLVNKYGVIPKKAFPEAMPCEETDRQLNRPLYAKLREYARDLYQLLEKGGSDADAQAKINECMKVVFRIVGICVGVPPERFDFEYVDKDKEYHKISGITPLEFYTTHVKPLFNVDDKVCIVNDPRPSTGYGRPVVIEYLGNCVGGRDTVYNNQPIEVMMKAVGDSIKDGEAVWFGCDVRKFFHRPSGLLSTKISDYALLFGEDLDLPASKPDRLTFGLSMMTHAMVFTAVTLSPDNPLPSKFRVENSWGEEGGDKGYLIMTDEWFREFMLEVVVDKKYLSEEVLRAMDQPKVVLPPWDPMGALAK